MRLVRRKPKNPDGCGKVNLENIPLLFFDSDVSQIIQGTGIGDAFAAEIRCGANLELERVIGLTTSTSTGLACNGVSEELAYLAGCVVVVYNVRTNRQTHFLTATRNPKPFACVAYSGQGGKLIAAGESGHQPAVVVWEVATGVCISDMKSHKYGVACVQFSPNGKHLVSLGAPHDGTMCLWDYKSGALLMKTRAAAASLSATTLQFASDGNFFVSGGTKHLKHWTIGGPRPRATGMTITPVMDGKPIKLGSQKDSSFVSVSSASASKEHVAGAPALQPLYALTSAGILCLLHVGLAIEKWVDLQVRQAFALAISEGYVACACSDGVVRIFSQGSLEYTTTLPRPAPYGYHGLTDANVGAYLAVGQRVASGIKFPDAVACTFLQQGQYLAVIYNDHSLYVWDVRNYSKIGRFRTFLSHSSCIWDVVTIPDLFQPTSDKYTLPGEAFATCSADGTIRLWHLDLGQEDISEESVLPSSFSNEKLQNVYSKEILGVLYIDTLGEKGKLPAAGANEELACTAVAFRSISVSPDGNHLAAGDSSGNLRIYDLNNMVLHSFQEAHDAEILSLSYTAVLDAGNDLLDKTSLTIPLLASGGRDRLIHVYDVNRGYDVIETLDDHTASITTVKFACNGSKLLSCSADKSVVFRSVAVTSAGCKSSRYHQEIATRGTIYDMDTDASGKFAVAVGQEKKLNVLSISTGKLLRSFKPEGDVGEPIKVRMDPSGMYMVCSHSDRCMRIYNLLTGELLGEASGHAEVITGVAFLPDCRRLLSVSGDSCIFVWRLPLTLSRTMRKRCSSIAESRPPLKTLKSPMPRSKVKDIPRAAKIPRFHQLKDGQKLEEISTDENVHPIENVDNTVPQSGREYQDLEVETPHRERGAQVDEETPAAFKFSVSRLPPWAQAKIAVEEDNVSGGKGEATGKCNPSFESRWTERLGCEGYKLFSEFMEEATPPATIRASGFGARRRFSVEGGGIADTDGSPESSSSQLQSTPMSSPREAPRKETQWTTVHTVFLDDSDFDDSPKVAPLAYGSSQTPVKEVKDFGSKSPLGLEGTRQGKHEGEDVDHVEVGFSDDEGEPIGNKADEAVQNMNSKPGLAAAGPKRTDEEEVLLKASSKNKIKVSDTSQSVPSNPLNTRKRVVDGDSDSTVLSALDSDNLSVESEDDDGIEEDDFSPRRDLFSAHFDKLASDLKVGGSARSSFSARFFAQSNTKLSRSTLFQSSPAGGRVQLHNDTQVLLEDKDELELKPEKLLTADLERLKSQEQQQENNTEGAQLMHEKLVNVGTTGSGMLCHADSPQRSNIEECSNRNSCALRCKGSPNTPDCLPSGSPQLAQDRTRSHPTKFLNGTPLALQFSAQEKLPASPALPSQFQDKVTDHMKTRFGDHPNCGTVQTFDSDKIPDNGITCETFIEILPLSQKNLVDEHGVSQAEVSRDTSQIQAVDGIWKQSSSPSSVRITEHELESEKVKQVDEVEVFSSAIGLSVDRGDIGPLHSSWEPTSSRMPKTLPRPEEDYQKALKELLDAASKASLLYNEVHSLCQGRFPAEAAVISDDPSTLNLPSDVVRTGQAYKRLVPESLQLIQKLSDKVSACVFPPDCLEASKSSDAVGLYDFSFQKSNDYGDNGLHSWPRTSGASLDSLLSSVDVESFISRYSETLASQVLALVQKSLPSPPS